MNSTVVYHKTELWHKSVGKAACRLRKDPRSLAGAARCPGTLNQEHAGDHNCEQRGCHHLLYLDVKEQPVTCGAGEPLLLGVRYTYDTLPLPLCQVPQGRSVRSLEAKSRHSVTNLLAGRGWLFRGSGREPVLVHHRRLCVECRWRSAR